MDISQFETSTNHALIEIQRAQRVLDETQHKMKMFKRQKQSASKYASNVQFKNSALPDLRQYISYLINEEGDTKQPTGSSLKNIYKLQSTTQIRNRTQNPILDSNQLQNNKRTFKTDLSYHNQPPPSFDITKHTQEQLQKSHLIRLQKIQAMYRQQFEMLDKKIEELLKDREKVKKDKILLLRNNEELEQDIHQLREKRKEKDGVGQMDNIVAEMRVELGKLHKKISKVQVENCRIVKRKQDLEANMRVCIRNSKQQLEQDIQATRMKPSKSKSAISSKCPYH